MKLNIIVILGLTILCLPFHISYGQGARYTGSYTKSPTIKYTRESNFEIKGLEISGTSDESCITLTECENVIIKNCKFGPSVRHRAIYLYNCKNITIIDCTFENVQSGLIAVRSQSIKFEYNDVTNVVGKMNGATHFGNMAQFNEVSGTGNSISYNACENIPDQSSPEDIINLFKSHGTSSSPIMVKGNWFRGGGPSRSGGGIILGDNGGSFQVAEENIVVDPGQYGISIAGGNNMTIRNNKIYGSQKSFNNVGLYAANWTENLGKSHTITVANNRINYINKDGNRNNWWFAGNVEPIIGKETNAHDPNLSASVLPDKIIGRARSSSTPDDKPGENPTPPDGDTDKNNDSLISIYLDKYNRICINNRDVLEATATVEAKDGAGKTIHEEALTRFHTVLSNITAVGTYTILVKNGNKTHQKTLQIH